LIDRQVFTQGFYCQPLCMVVVHFS